ncbi:2-oxoglutarate carboxylase large subunit [Sporotomaculum syntrophicum]|uniref:2-oxoglutarate carboxylase large subunit n=1 Tax=Sporotomaculum syntrophicum TaxID=182264 RepID=A0A9D2WPB1_9FIRM|nr:biotin/lipoyl-containing protein [Sporotomaculum syntrophicum]KAF1084650.1 2-oxoglutarate carboxylase large subunit [Sporotomaculum syntrophicum]
MKKFKIVVNGETFEVEVEELTTTLPTQTKVVAQAVTKKGKTYSTVHGLNNVTAPLPGNVNEIKVSVGDQVNVGDVLIILEAMKMENEITAPIAGMIKELLVKKGQVVQSDELLIVIE